MHEILFRGKNKYINEWIVGSLVNTNEGAFIVGEECLTEFFKMSTEIDPSTVGQFTGLFDKNQERIFEGDIISGVFLFGMEVKSVCIFKNGSFGLKWYRGNVEEFTPFTSMCNIEFEVIGNIYDNFEMIGATENE